MALRLDLTNKWRDWQVPMDATWCAADEATTRTSSRASPTSAIANSFGAAKSSAARASYEPKSSPANEKKKMKKKH